ncbi:GntR family transcriptional regulator [bacterium]|nr:GntR family transcriptional regulator [bacterium]
MFIKIDPRSSTPIYVQIVDQVKYQIASGRLRVGDRLPTVRELAVELRVNPNTVAKAYRELDREQVTEGRPGQGSFIRGGDMGLSLERRREMVGRSMEVPVVQAYHLDLEQDAVRDILETELGKIYVRDTRKS